MSLYFKLKCFEAENTKKIIIVSSLIVAAMGVIHWGYCVSLSRFLTLYYEYLKKPGNTISFTTYDQYKKMVDSPMAFYAITGIQQILTSILVVLIALGYLGNTSKLLWARILAILLLFNFAFNFVIATSSSMSATYYNQLFKDQINRLNAYAGGVLNDWEAELIVMVKYTTAEAVISFLINLPLIGLITVAFMESSFKAEYLLDSERSVQPSQVDIRVDQSIVS